jgi:hypothetical protein
MRLKAITKRVQDFTGKRGLHDDLAYLVNEMFYSAVQNADDDARPEWTLKQYEQHILNSLEVRLACTPERAVQDWYRKQGFTW